MRWWLHLLGCTRRLASDVGLGSARLRTHFVSSEVGSCVHLAFLSERILFNLLGLTMDSLSASQLSGLKSEEIMDQIRQQLAIANAQLVIQKMTEKCFAKCISKPGSSLDNSEQKCVAMCMDRYMDSHSVVSTAYLNRLRQ